MTPPDDPIDRSGLPPRYWETVALQDMDERQWEALCDGCGKCCLNKLEDDETREVAFTRVACRLLDGDTCRCARYEIRHQFVPECVTLSPKNIAKNAYWMPKTCAYKLLYEGQPLPDWHPLISGRADSVAEAGVSVRGWTVSEASISEDDWEDYLLKGEL